MQFPIIIDDEYNKYIMSDLSFDINGNLYIDISSCLNNPVCIKQAHTVYQVCINGKNTPYADPGIYTILNTTKPQIGGIYDDLTTTNDNTSDDDNDDDIDDAENIDDDVNPLGTVSDKYYIEEKDYLYSIPTNNYLDSNFYFCGDDTVNIYDRLHGDVLALYDTFLYKNDINIFRTKLLGEPPFYVIKLLIDSGIIGFRIIYDTKFEVLYRLKLNKDGTMEFKIV